MSTVLLVARNLLSCHLSGQAIFPPQTFTLHSGDCLQVTGGNGSGKSTLLRLLASLKTPDHGTFQRPDSLLYLGHQNGLLPWLSVGESLQLAAALMEHPLTTPALSRLAEKAGLYGLLERRTDTLSAGQARRLALARLLLKPAPLWILDEPAAALDTAGKIWLQGLIGKQLASGGMVVMATHEPESGQRTLALERSNQSQSQQQGVSLLFGSALERSNQPQSQQQGVSLLFGSAKKRDTPCPPLSLTLRQEWQEQKQAPFTTAALLLKTDLKGFFRHPAACFTPLLFFALGILLFGLVTAPDAALLHAIAPGVIWITALLSVLLSMESLFRREAENGCLDFWLTVRPSLLLPVFSRLFTHWLAHGLPLTLLAPLAGLMTGLQTDESVRLFFSLLAGTPTLSLTGGIGAALLAGVRGQSLLLPVLVMPLYIPVLVFGTAAVFSSAGNAAMALLLALLLAAITVSGGLVQAGLRTGRC